MKNLTHIDSENRAIMVDVTPKPDSHRIAKAGGFIELQPATLELISNNKMKKGNVLTTAELAGIQAAKRTSELIPLCHNIVLTSIKVQALIREHGIEICSEVTCVGKTGVEMEALTAVSTALLTIYDMCKAVDKKMVLGDIKLLMKQSG